MSENPVSFQFLMRSELRKRGLSESGTVIGTEDEVMEAVLEVVANALLLDVQTHGVVSEEFIAEIESKMSEYLGLAD